MNSRPLRRNGISRSSPATSATRPSRHVELRELDAPPPTKGEFRFHCFAEKCFLREVIEPGSKAALVLPMDRLESEYARCFQARVVIASSE